MWALVVIALFVLFVTGAGARPAALPQQQGRVDLVSQANVEIHGAVAQDQAGDAVAMVGDVDGDGRGDVLVGAPGASNNARTGSGSAYVVFGQEAPTKVDLSALGNQGFRIDGAAVGDRAGDSVGAAGDVNGDGRADVFVGAHGADNNGRSGSGSAYVVFGKRSSSAVDLAALGDQGFRIDGAAPGDHAGHAVAGAGDVNGDGRADVLVAANFANNNERRDSGSAYVVFGKRSSASVDLAALGEQGFRIDGAAPGDRAGHAVAGAGDVNGDGRADVLVGAVFADNNGRPASGSAYVVFGKSSSATVDLAALGEQGFRIDGAAPFDFAAASVSGAGDVSGDGRGDVLVGAIFADNNGRRSSGSAYVVFGTSSSATVDLAALGEQGFRIDGAAPSDFAAASVSGAGDINGDGRVDVLVGAHSADNDGRENSGSAYVVFGRSSSSTVDLAALGDQGFRIDGAAARDAAATSVGGAGDVNGDGRSDVLVGADGADSNGRSGSGSAYVVYGFGAPQLAYRPLVATAGKAIVPHAPRLVLRTGPASFSVSPSLPTGLRLDRKTGVVSGTPAVALRTTTYAVTMRDLAGVVRAALRVTVKAGADRRAPRLALGGPLSQRALTLKGVIVRVSCDEPCRLSASGMVTVQGARAAIRLGSARATLKAAGAATLKLALSPAAQRRLAQLLKQGKRALATVAVRALDRAGNARTARRTIVVRR